MKYHHPFHRAILRTATILTVLACVQYADAAPVTVTAPNKTKFKLYDDGHAEFTSISSYDAGANPDLVLPDVVEYNGNIYKVTVAAAKCCQNKSALKSFTCGQYLTTVDSAAFYNNPDLVSVNLGNSVVTVRGKAFANCPALQSVSGLQAVQWFGDNVFEGDVSLSTFSIPAATRYIGANLFLKCSSLSSIDVSTESVHFSSSGGVLFNKSGSDLIYYPNGRTDDSYTVPEGVVCLRASAISDNRHLKSLILPASLQTIGSMALSNNIFTALHLGENVGYIGPGAVCATPLVSITVAPGNINFNASGGYLFSKDGKTLVLSVVREGELTLPDGTETIGDYVFSQMQAITAVTLPPTVRYIGEHAFSRNTALVSITLNEGLHTLGRNCFQGATALKTVRFPSTVRTIGFGAFMGATSLTDITLNEGLENTGEGTFLGCTALRNIKLPSTVKTIEYESFYGCSSLTDIGFNEGLTNIGKLAFQECTSLTTLRFPSSLRVIGNQAFSTCTALKNIHFNNGLQEIGQFAFDFGEALEHVVIPGSVTKLGNGPFSDSQHLKSVVFEPGELSYLSEGCFYDCPELESVTLHDNIREIRSAAFNIVNLGNFTFPPNTELIGHMAFLQAGLTGEIVVPNTVTFVGASAFRTNPRIKKIVLGQKVTALDTYAMAECDRLETVELNEGLRTIANYCFSASGMTSLTIPSTVESMGMRSLENVKRLSDLYMKPAAPPATTGELFKTNSWNGYEKVVLHVPAGSLELYRSNAEWGKFLDIRGDVDGVDSTAADDAHIVEIFDLKGNRLSCPASGVNIIRYSDGSVKKVIVAQ